ncbi:MAG: S8 family peptidase [Gemmatimonadaceae bacterium]
MSRASNRLPISGWNGAWCDAPYSSGHGTEVASIIGGSVHGVAKGVQLIGVRAFDCTGSFPVDSMLLAVDWVTSNHQKPAVANLSAGCDGICASLDLAIANSVTAGVTWVVAAGNDGNDACLNSPGRSAEAISVGATRPNDSRLSASSWGSCIALFAPGADIPLASHLSNTATTVDSGTSFAAPHVAGVAALYLQEHPQATPAQVRTAVLSWATPSRLTNIGTGSPNLLVFAPPPTTVSMSGPSALPTAGTYSWDAHPGGGDGTYTFQWDVRYWGTTAWESLGTASSQALSFTGGDADFELRVTATSVGHSVSSTRTVHGPCHNHPWIACPFSVGEPIEVAEDPVRGTTMARRVP